MEPAPPGGPAAASPSPAGSTGREDSEQPDKPQTRHTPAQRAGPAGGDQDLYADAPPIVATAHSGSYPGGDGYPAGDSAPNVIFDPSPPMSPGLPFDVDSLPNAWQRLDQGPAMPPGVLPPANGAHRHDNGNSNGLGPAGSNQLPPPTGSPVPHQPPAPDDRAPAVTPQLPPAPTGTSVRMPPAPTSPVHDGGIPPPAGPAGVTAPPPPVPIGNSLPGPGPIPPPGAPAGSPADLAGSAVDMVSVLTGAQEAARIEDAIALGQTLLSNLRHVVLGTPGALTAVAVAALSGGHLLIEDVPGVGKTVLAQALAASLGTELSRLQGHPDLLPSDVTGVSVFSPDSGTWEFKPGPVFAHLILVDELNRTPPRTQAALLETMEEQQVSADGESWPLPVPHLVIATQNPHSQLGTYPLVESQLDRFALATAIGYPDAEVETQIVLQHGGRPALHDLRPVCTPGQWHAAQLATQMVVVEESVAAYAVALCRGSRSVSGVRLGASPRAAIWLVRTAQAHAVLSGRAYVTPGDVKAMAVSCLSHRLTTDDGVAYGVRVVRALLDSTPAPRP